MKPSVRLVRVLVDELEHASELEPARARRRAAPGVGRSSGEMSGSSPEPDAVHGVDRHVGPGGDAVQLAVRLDPLLDGREEVGVRRAEVRRRARRAVVPVSRRRGARVEPLAPLERLTEERRADDDVRRASNERAVRAVGHRELRDAGHGERVDDADEHRERDEREERGNELTTHQETPSPLRAMSTSLMPTNGATMPPAP